MHIDEKRYILPVGKIETHVKHLNCYSFQNSEEDNVLCSHV